MDCCNMKDIFWHLKLFFVGGPTTARARPKRQRMQHNTHSHNQRLYPTSGHVVLYPLLDINDNPECNQHKEDETVAFLVGRNIDG